MQKQDMFYGLDPVQRQKITQACKQYGLNQQEMKQLVNEMIFGDDAKQYQNEETNKEVSFNHFEQEYSFKQKFISKQRINSEEHSFEKAMILKMRDQEEKFENIKKQNSQLIKNNKQLQSRAEILLQMKQQQNQIIIGLKNAISQLTSLLKNKQKAYIKLNDNYTKIVNTINQKHEVDQEQINPSRKHSKHHYKHSDPISLSPQVKLSQISLSSSNILRKQSRDISCTKPPIPPKQQQSNSSNIFSDNLKLYQQPRQTTAKKQNTFDLNKYKGFIDELRNTSMTRHR